MNVHYIYDTLCGWCFIAHAEIQKMVKHLPDDVKFQFHHRRLFHGAGEMTISDNMLEMVRRVGQEVGPARTGQRVGDAHIEFLKQPGIRYNSDLTARAVAAAAQIERDCEFDFAIALQKAVFERGLDFNSPKAISECFSHATGRPAGDLLQFLEGENLAQEVELNAERAQALMHQVRSNGVPCLLLEDDGALHELDAYSSTNAIRVINEKLTSA